MLSKVFESDGEHVYNKVVSGAELLLRYEVHSICILNCVILRNLCCNARNSFMRCETLPHRQAQKAREAAKDCCVDAEPKERVTWPVYEPWPQPEDDILRLYDYIAYQSEVSFNFTMDSFVMFIFA